MGTKRRVAVIDHFRNNARGGHGLHEAFMGLPGIEICAAADPDEQSSISLQKDTGAPFRYTDWRCMLAEQKPDIACICSRLPVHHPDVVTGAAENGCHIYCEKPFATSLEAADRMVDAADRAGVKLAVAHLARYSSSFRTAKRILESGELGRPVTVYCRGKEDDRGGGEDMMVLGTHLFDITRFLFGDPAWVFGHVATERRDAVPNDAHAPTEPVGTVAGDAITAVIGFPGNIHCHFESRKDAYAGGDWHFGITIACTNGKLTFRYGEAERILRISRGGRPFEDETVFEPVVEDLLPDIPGAQPLSADKCSGLNAYFANGNRQAAWDLVCAVDEGREPVSSGKDARWALEMIHGVYTSHFSGERIPLPLINRNHPLDETGEEDNACRTD